MPPQSPHLRHTRSLCHIQPAGVPSVVGRLARLSRAARGHHALGEQYLRLRVLSALLQHGHTCGLTADIGEKKTMLQKYGWYLSAAICYTADRAAIGGSLRGGHSRSVRLIWRRSSKLQGGRSRNLRLIWRRTDRLCSEGLGGCGSSIFKSVRSQCNIRQTSLSARVTSDPNHTYSPYFTYHLLRRRRQRAFM